MKAEIKRGIALLNRKQPGWFNSIDLDTLDLESLRNCVLGQLNFGSFGCGMIELGLTLDKDEFTHGFDLTCKQRYNSAKRKALFAAYNAQWKLEIIKLKEKANI